MLATLLLQSNPAEVVVMRGGQLSGHTLRLLKRHKPLSPDGMDRWGLGSRARRGLAYTGWLLAVGEQPARLCFRGGK
jgi:hypothetical protein